MKGSTAHMLFQKKWFNLPKESFATWQLTDGSNFFLKKVKQIEIGFIINSVFKLVKLKVCSRKRLIFMNLIFKLGSHS